MNLSATFSKTGKGVQEASGKTSHLSRADRAVLSAIDGKTPLTEVQKHFEKLAGPKFEALIQQLDKDGFIREVSSGAAAATSARPAAPPPRAAPPPPSGGSDDDMDFTQAVKLPPKAPAAAAPKAPPVDLAAAGRAEAERKAKEAGALDYKARQEAETKAKAEAELKARAAQEARLKAEAESKARAEAEAKARAAAEAKGRADAEAKARGESEAKARAEADSKTRAEADAKVKAAREAAVRMATEAKAKAEADAKAKTDAAERDKARLETELNAKLDAERKAREDAERRAAEAAETARRELEEKAKRDAEELRQKLEAEMKAKLDAERKAREEEDRKRRDEEDRRRKEEDERRAKEDAERRAREEADRKKREEEERKRREDDERRRREDDERRAKEDAERRAREEEDRKKRKEEDERRAKEEAERRAKDDAERRALEDTNRRLETDRRAKEEAERKAEADRRAKEDAERRAKDEAEAKARASASAASLPKIETVAPPPPPPPAAPAGGGLGDSLLADLDSFGKREEEEQREKEEAERKAKADTARRAKEEAERKAKEEAERKAKEEAEKKRREEEERRAKEEAERKEREEEQRRKEEEDERKRKAKEAMAAKQAEERAAKAAAAGSKAGKGAKPAAHDDDIGVTDEDLDTDDLKRDQKVAAEKARKTVREQPAPAVAGGRPKKWGKPAAIALFVLLIAGVGVLQVMPLSTAEYEKAASDAMGVPVKISSARLSVITGIEVKLEGVSVGDAVKIHVVRGSPEVGSLFGAHKSFSRVDLEGVSISQSQIAAALLGKVSGENFRIGRITAKQLALDGPLKLPPLDMDATVAGDGSLQTVKLAGPDKLSVTLSPKGGEIGFEMSAASWAPPFVPALSLSEFAMKGSANSAGITTSEFDGRVYDGVLKGSARVRWGANWSVEGELRSTGLKVAVFAPTLVSDGRVDGRAAYSMAGSTPATLYESARVQGDFKIDKGVIGSFDLARALQTGGTQSGGRTVFNELTGQGLYDKGTVQISNASISAGAMNAGLSLNIDASGGLSGRVVADIKTASQSLRATLNISGKVQDPVIRK